MRRTRDISVGIVLFAVLGFIIFQQSHIAAMEQSHVDDLEQGFKDPPDSAKPRVWWHWMNGNVTKEGIQLDLEWMKRVGIGGFQNFDASLGTPQVVEKRLVFMTPEWKDAFRYAATLADHLGLEMAIAGSPGWSESGGPWVTPEHAMKKLVWSETRVEGGRPFSGKIPKPPRVTGPLQDLPQREYSFKPDPSAKYYADSAVVAYRIPDGETPQTDLHPKVTSSGGAIDDTLLSDGDLARSTSLPKAPLGQQAWVQFEYSQPQTIHAITIAVNRPYRVNEVWSPVPESGEALQVSDDGTNFRTVVDIPNSRVEQRTLSFPKVTARFFRVTFTTIPEPPDPMDGKDWDGTPIPHPPAHQISELNLHTGSRVHWWEEKAAFGQTTQKLMEFPTAGDADSVAIPKAAVIDLTNRLGADEKLTWTPPPGRWVIIRLGYSLTGHKNGPASTEATGLEVDKLNKNFVTAYFNNYLDQYQSAVGKLMGARGLQYVITDSWEAGLQNWTDNMIPEFTRRRGYSPLPYLPVLTGKVVESGRASDQFLWDFRKTLAELVAENHYDALTEILRRRGMRRYTESHESGRALIADGMEVKRSADVPMSAMWTPPFGTRSETQGPNYDIRESASVAHIYGQNLVAAESLTASGSAWMWSPETLKPTADMEMAMGLNRFVIHTSVHQPLSDKQPGLGLGPFGQWFTRHETWAEQAGPWLKYLARSCYLLQQGKFVADVAYYYGEDSNITALFDEKSQLVPDGYHFDFVNADALLNKLSVQGGRLVTPSGMNYRVLVLDPNSRFMSLPVLRKIRDLTSQGALVVGNKPVATPSLADDQKEFDRLTNELWGSGVGPRTVSKGQIFANQKLAEVLASLRVGPDFEYAKPQPDTKLLFVHRALSDGEIYWVDNRNNLAQLVDATFRVQGKAPELWHPDTGDIEPAGYRIANGRTTVSLRLNPGEAVFVVFRKPATSDSRVLPVQVERPTFQLDHAWEVSFQPDRGAPAKASFNKLISWSESSDPGIKYFSGTATYSQTFNAPADWFKPGARLWLDLGDVKNLAEVLVNGKALGVIWKTPFRVDVGDTLKVGANRLEVRVTNLWVNRLIGDQQPNVARKYTYTTQDFYQANSPLLPSGLLGPVRLIRLSVE